jgi:hypothetical protein
MLQLLALLTACPAIAPGFTATNPSSGATLPRNARIHLLGPRTDGEPLVTIATEDSELRVEPSRVDGLMTVDLTALAVTGTITLHATVDESNADSVTARFFIDDDSDLAPPADFSGITTLSFRWNGEEPWSSCGPSAEFLVIAAFAPLEEDWETALYQLYEVFDDRDPALIGRTFGEDLVFTVFGSADGEGVHCYRLVAFDVAGNSAGESAPATCINLTRDPETDAGVLDGGGDIVPDAGPSTDAAPRETGDLELDTPSCGCSSARPVTRFTTGWLLLMVFAVKKLRRRGG